MRALLDLFAEAWHAIRGSPGLSTLAFLILCLGWISSVTGIGMAFVFSETKNGALPAHFKAIGESEGETKGAIWGSEAIKLRKQLPSDLRASSIMVRRRLLNVSDSFRPTQVEGVWIDGPLFASLNWRMAIGRDFNEAEQSGTRAVMIISHRFWQAQFAGAQDALGKSLKVDGLSREIVGILPPYRAFPFHEQIYLPTRIESGSPLASRYVLLLMNAPPNVLPALNRVIQTINAEGQDESAASADPAVSLKPKRLINATNLIETGLNKESALVIDVTIFLSQLLMLVASCNAGGLLLIRWVLRSAELATRASLGATVQRLSAVAIAQALLIAVAAFVLAFVVSGFLAGYLQAFFHTQANGVPEYIQFNLGMRAVLPLLGALLLTVAIVAAPVVWRLSKSNLNAELKKRERGLSADYRMGKLLLSVQCVFAVVSLSVAIFSLMGAWKANRIDYGMATDGVLLTTVRSTSAQVQRDFVENLAEALRKESNVSAVSVSIAVPQTQTDARQLLDLRKSAPLEPRTIPLAEVDVHFAEVYGIPMRAGRWLASGVQSANVAEAVINETLADARFGGAAAAVGQTLSYLELDNKTQTNRTIVGVSSSVRIDADLAAQEFLVFAPIPDNTILPLSISIKTQYARPQSLIPRLEQLALELNDAIAIAPPRTYGQARAESSKGLNVIVGFFLPLGIVAVLMTASGLGALLSTLVAQRMRDCSLRRALGAPALQLVRPLLQSLLITCAGGIVIGLAIAAPLTVQINKILYSNALSVSLALFLTLLIVGATLALACLRPVWRALHADPMQILRQI